MRKQFLAIVVWIAAVPMALVIQSGAFAQPPQAQPVLLPTPGKPLVLEAGGDQPVGIDENVSGRGADR